MSLGHSITYRGSCSSVSSVDTSQQSTTLPNGLVDQQCQEIKLNVKLGLVGADEEDTDYSEERKAQAHSSDVCKISLEKMARHDSNEKIPHIEGRETRLFGLKERRTAAQKEIKLTKIANGQYRKVKTWGRGISDEASMLLMTSDGGEFGYSGCIDNDGTSEQNSIPEGRRRTNDIPFRLIFNSNEIIDILCGITNSVYLNGACAVILRPFKFLIHNEATIRHAHSQFEAALEAGADVENLDHNQSRGSVRPLTDDSDSVGESIQQHEANEFMESGTGGMQEALEEVDSNTDKPLRRMCGVEVSHRNREIIRLVVDFMDHEMNDILTVRKRIADKTLECISFEYLPHLFKSGDLIIKDTGSEVDKQRAYRILHVTGGRPHLDQRSAQRLELSSKRWTRGQRLDRARNAHRYFDKLTPVVLDCFYIDFDGKEFGPRSKQFVLYEYKGFRKITSLEVVPAAYISDKTLQVLHDRGKLFVEIASWSHMCYNGDAYYKGRSVFGGWRVERIQGQCIIDQKTAIYENWKIKSYKGRPEDVGPDDLSPEDVSPEDGFESLDNPLGFGTGVIQYHTHSNDGETYELIKSPSLRNAESCGPDADVNTDDSFDLRQREEYMMQNPLLRITKYPNKDHYVLLPDQVWGYVLSRRGFYRLRVSNLSAVQWDARGSPFEDLVLPATHKSTIEALVRYQTLKTRDEMTRQEKVPVLESANLDLIGGKGQGLTILLHGMPGTGKTSTAECVAEQLRRPLLTLTCGDLGVSPENIEPRLNAYFRLATKWSCVILLDEADVFLTHRTTGDYARNSIVSGILILTTNRVGEFDEAVASRIHIKLHYPRLDRSSAMDIWRLNIRRVMENRAFEVKTNGSDILKFAEKHWKDHEGQPGRQWNGRQIKNAFQTAIALAYFDWDSAPTSERKRLPVLRRKHFKQVAETSVHFDRHMDKIHGARSQGAYSETAHRYGYRYDEPDNDMLPTPKLESNRLNRLSAASQHQSSRPLLPTRYQHGEQTNRSATDTGSSEEASETDNDDNS